MISTDFNFGFVGFCLIGNWQFKNILLSENRLNIE